MKNFLKRANRGLILAAVVIAGFVVFVIMDTASFKKNKPEIETAVNEYLDALSECAVTTASKDDFHNKTEKLMADYWCSDNRNSENDWGLKLGSFRNQLDLTAEEIYSGKSNSGEVKKWNAAAGNIRITKAGAGYAKVSFSCDIVAEYKGNPYILTPCEIMPVSDFIYYDDNAETSDNELKQFSMNADYELNMKQTDGKWKVCSSESWGWCSPTITILDETEGGND